MKKPSLIIIGAGATGLMAANELANSHDITILEALDRVGGRIHTLYSRSGQALEAGAEFIHGKMPLTMELVKKAGADMEEVGGVMYRISNCDWIKQEEMIEGWDQILSKMDSIPEDMTLDAFLETHFTAPGFEELRRHTRAYAASFDLADPVKASVKALRKEWSQEAAKQYRIRQGYQSIIRYLQQQCPGKGCRIRTGKKVKQVDWQKNEVTVYTADNERYQAEKLLVTLPVGLLQKKISACSINITPPLDNYDTAWQRIGYGSVLKVILCFKEAFWKTGQRNAGFILSEEVIPTWWTQLPSEVPMLTGWLGGPAAVQWDAMDDTTVLEHAVVSLAHIFRKDAGDITALLIEHHIFRWHAMEAAVGAYSFETPLSAEAKKTLTIPIEDTVYFAGEALYTGPYPGTVEASLNNAVEVAKKIVAGNPG